MFNKEELTALFVFMNERATFNMTGKEADMFVGIKNRIAEEYNKLTSTKEDKVDNKKKK